MANKEKEVLSKNPKWSGESEKIREIQLAFDFGIDVDTALRLAAARRHVPPSAIVRERLGLPIATPTRKRISVSVNESELKELAKKYNIDPEDKAQIKKRIAIEISENFQACDEGLGDAQLELEKAQRKLAKLADESKKITSSLQGLFDKQAQE